MRRFQIQRDKLLETSIAKDFYRRKDFEVFRRDIQLIACYSKLSNIFDIKTQIEANNIVDLFCLTRLNLFLLFRRAAFVASVLALANIEKEIIDLRRKIDELEKKLKSKKREMAN